MDLIESEKHLRLRGVDPAVSVATAAYPKISHVALALKLVLLVVPSRSSSSLLAVLNPHIDHGYFLATFYRNIIDHPS